MNRNVYIEARNLIANRRFADAYRMLKEVVSSDRNAEWFFLTGTAAMKMGRDVYKRQCCRWRNSLRSYPKGRGR